ncbi:hypothetical protein BV898_16264 [Hypsibius exemplaris]|uniref:Secretory-abundant heat soluble protein 64681 n=1 Tax=Hypsibius exemplaris TaxID=2072580 RepID=SAHS3_HYPEX|nr:RecName: Full=Secretory-abundant heat soluble protein 64681; Short=SAHS 63681; AltName: Full=Secretory-abundant heat soluble protein c; Short=SAHS-c; AltName: Full=Tardigrade-specific intrinsically disordered protein SAHS 64681; Short=TDP SAHS 64681; Flags: Precursor [Hypsibius exemplaris]OWA51798.1 hypothetical protein BV898_16264 [Hypsibius exemplaris]
MSRTIVALILLGLAALAAADHHEGHGAEKEWAGKAWLGKWVSTDRSENWDAFVEALGLPLAAYGGNHKTVHKLWKEGDHYHHQIIIADKSYKQDIQFKLGEEGRTAHNGTEVTFKYTEVGDNLQNEVKIPSKNKTISDSYVVKGDELEKTYKINDVVAKRWYKKHAHEPSTA